MIWFAWWSLLVISTIGVMTRIGLLAYKGTKMPGAAIFGLAIETWAVVALLVWLHP